MQSLLILGRQPALGLAELESLYGSAQVKPAGTHAAIVNVVPSEINFARLGGSVKACKLLTTLETTDWSKIESYLIKTTPEHAAMLPDGKLTIGLSVYGIQITPGKLNAAGLSIKKAIRKSSGRSVRLVPNNEVELSSAQVYHNHLTAERAWELVLVADGNQTHLAQTFAVQDIDAYTLRDRGRPKRDTRVGMLPPKLAQTIINLATTPQTPALSVLLDPFCGTGVVLQEALLMGYRVYGTDIEPRMIDYSNHNLTWLDDHFPDLPPAQLEIGDATTHQWKPAPNVVACETYLGRPFTTVPANDLLAQNSTDCNLIIKRFLQNIYTQLPSGTRLCIAVPAWQIRRNGFKHLPLVDSLSEIGYNRVSFEHVRDDQLLYYREDQVVARELLVITRK